MKFNYLGLTDYYIELNSMRLHLRIKFLESDGTDISSAEPNTAGCVNNLFHSIFSSLRVSLKGKPVNFQRQNIFTKSTLKDSKLRF